MISEVACEPELPPDEMMSGTNTASTTAFAISSSKPLIAVAVGVITLFVATCAAFAISRLKVKGGRTVLNLALFTYFIPAAFLAVPMYKTMANYGLINNKWSLVLAMVTIASPYCIWVLKQASDKLPYELDEAAVIDGAGDAASTFTRNVVIAEPGSAATLIESFASGRSLPVSMWGPAVDKVA